MSEKTLCPYCDQLGYYSILNAFKCVKCGTKAIQGGDSKWYYEEHHFTEFEELKKRFKLEDWFKEES